MMYRRLPASLQNFWILNLGYIRYCKNLNQLILKKHYEGNIILIDRYLHDMWVKNTLHENGMSFIDYIYATLFRKPRLAIMLNDKADNILSRKQELSASQIDRYQVLIADSLDKTGITSKSIDVEGLNPDQVAREIIKHILSSMGGDAINFMRTQIQLLKRSNSD